MRQHQSLSVDPSYCPPVPSIFQNLSHCRRFYIKYCGLVYQSKILLFVPTIQYIRAMAAKPSSSRLHSVGSKQQPRRKRTAGKRVSYREADSDSDEANQASCQDDHEPVSSLPSRLSKPPRRRSARIPSAKTLKKRKAPCLPRRSLGGVKRAKTRHIKDDALQNKQDNTAIQMTGKAMPWNTLPYQILVSIFEYASWPLVADAITPLPSISWLLGTALCCKAFAEPALAALYHSPPLARKGSSSITCRLAVIPRATMRLHEI